MKPIITYDCQGGSLERYATLRVSNVTYSVTFYPWTKNDIELVRVTPTLNTMHAGTLHKYLSEAVVEQKSQIINLSTQKKWKTRFRT